MGKQDSTVIKAAAHTEMTLAFFLFSANCCNVITRYSPKNIRNPFVKKNESI